MSNDSYITFFMEGNLNIRTEKYTKNHEASEC